ncbi:glucose PTS transporter subunit IIA [Mesomycoplasma lagogenitalium]|uniref:Glucose PTS transporter subunit IIA n=1 Tax=Mesomycoplasma lagogenitalium TaxID=171286 RepID=A0ABY8LTH8_9BACT|nr:glucose PTS transporter subunit IIA [Mesomycoplasma lagogenitalium]WGI36548.1 glucose PTS transporter subunit IIA [Mesomycoplasma lagogenitalium]
MNYKKIAQEIIDNVGGKVNIVSVKHCMTRLRLVLQNENLANTDKIKKMAQVISVVKAGGQYQIIIGNEVKNVFNAVNEILGFINANNNNNNLNQDKKTKLLSRFLDFIVGVITPALPILIVSGLLKGIVATMSAFKVPSTDAMFIIMKALGDSTFNFLPVFIAYNVAKRKDINVYVAMSIAIFLVFPSIVYNFSGAVDGISVQQKQVADKIFVGTIFETDVYARIGKMPIIWPKGGYASSFIPIIIILLSVSKLNRFLKRVTPQALSMITTNLIVFFVGSFFGLLFIGPLASWAQQILNIAIKNIYNFSPILVGLIVGFFWQILVIFGLHWSLVPIALLEFASAANASPLAAIIFFPFVTQIGILLALMVLEKRKIDFSKGISALASAFFGITEPTIYGFTLSRKKTFVLSCVVSGIIGAIAGAFQIKVFGALASGFVRLPLFIDPVNGFNLNFYLTLILTFGGLFASFLLMLMFYKVKLPEKAMVKINAFNTKMSNGYSDFKTKLNNYVVIPVKTHTIDKLVVAKSNLKSKIQAKMSKNNVIKFKKPGDYLPLEKVNDQAFASKSLGKGIAFNNFNNNALIASQDFTVVFVAETKHAIALKTKTGIDILIHIGIDTVNLNGKYFKSDLKVNDVVKKGETIIEFDYQKITEEGYDNSLMITLPTKEQYKDIEIKETKDHIEMRIK